jgi:hypothetical protein
MERCSKIKSWINIKINFIMITIKELLFEIVSLSKSELKNKKMGFK